jgi:tetratricopeptide (TPR) repeat protein
MSTLNERRSATAMWTAAGLFDEGGNHGRAISVLRAFVRERGDAEIIPRVLLRLGRSLQAEEYFKDAVDAYQRNISSFPRSPHANASLIPLAECFMSLGVDYETEAENALQRIIQNSAIFTPDAPEFRDAMYLLGDLYCRQGRYEEALPILDETLRNYPNDARVSRGMFLAADAYMHSALAIKDELLLPEFVGDIKRLRAELTNRFEEAAERFRTLRERLEQSDEARLGELDRIYLRDARLYEAACHFELGRYKDALALYERAAWIYKDSPASLGAYVQVINCYIFLGRKPDAESALRRAQYLVRSIADEHFQAAGQFESREGWERYFEWVAEILVTE